MTWQVLRGWRGGDTQLLPAVRRVFAYDEREPGRATGWLWFPAGPPVTAWPGPLADLGPWLLADLKTELGTAFTVCCFQAYRDGTGVGWHADPQWSAQAILSLGVTRSFGLRGPGGETFTRLAHGDLLFMPPGFQDEWQHCVPEEEAPGERVSLVFRSPG